MMNLLSVPADFKKTTIDKLHKLNELYKFSKVRDTYGNLSSTEQIVASGRKSQEIPKIDLNGLTEYVEYSKKYNIDFNYTLNALHYNSAEFTVEGINTFKKLLLQLHAIGIKKITISIPPLIQIIKSTGLDFKVCISTLNQIATVNKAIEYQELGVDSIVLDESIIRNFSVLERIRAAFNGEIKIIVNTLCRGDCTYRTFHYNLTASNLQESNLDKYYFYKCFTYFSDSIANNLRRMWVRPEDLHYYRNIGINSFKIQGRDLIEVISKDNNVFYGDIVKTAEAYMRESFEGNIEDLIYMFNQINMPFTQNIPNSKLNNFLKPFWEKKQVCRFDCSNCNYCENYARKYLAKYYSEDKKRFAQAFFNLIDSFMTHIKKDK